MVNVISKKMLKSALVELAKSDREFFVALLSDTLENVSPEVESTTTAKPTKHSGRRKPLPAKINPPYRRNIEALRKKYVVDKSKLLAMRELFADAPPAEIIIESLTK